MDTLVTCNGNAGSCALDSTTVRDKGLVMRTLPITAIDASKLLSRCPRLLHSAASCYQLGKISVHT